MLKKTPARLRLRPTRCRRAANGLRSLLLCGTKPRRPRLRELIGKVPSTHRCRVAAHGHRVALCYCRTHRRVPGPALAAVADHRTPPELDRLVGRFDRHVDRPWQGRETAA